MRENISQAETQSPTPPPQKTAPPLAGLKREQFVQSFDVIADSAPEIDGGVKAIAFYQSQFHPIPENDTWLGKEFPYWTSVFNAQPQFAGHHQPHLPGELGSYDLRLNELREQQARLAREYGLHGFCYHYHWFQGRGILERRLDMMLDSGSPDFPFCICWAHENLSRTWDGLEADVQLRQEHTEASDLAFIQDVLPILKDARYIRINGAPLLLVYRVSLLPAPARTSAQWRQACREAGLETIHLCAVETAGTPEPQTIGFDSSVQFPPHNLQARRSEGTVDDLNPHFTGQIHDYGWTVADEMTAPPAPYRRFRGVMPSWDNTPRRGPAATIYANSSPEAYELWLKSVVDATKSNLPPGERFLFINAWNGWAEGAYLEPDQRLGRAYLEATRRALTRTSSWETLVEYARSHQGMSGAVLADWVSDVEAILRSQQQSLRCLPYLQQARNVTSPNGQAPADTGAEEQASDMTKVVERALDRTVVKGNWYGKQLPKPLVSVVVPCYNHEQFVEAAIRSISAQDYPRVEIIFIDDASEDGSLEVARQTLERPEIGSRLEAVQVVLNDVNLGPARTINKGMALASGEYLAILNSDDLFGPTRLSRIIAEMQSERTGFGFSRVVPIDQRGDPMPLDALPTALNAIRSQDLLLTSFPAVSFGFFSENVAISTGNFVFTRKIWETVGPFRDLDYVHDFDFALAAILECEPVYVPEDLYFYRIHGTNSFASLAHVAEVEGLIMVRRLVARIRANKVKNPRAPTRRNWPGFIDSFRDRLGILHQIYPDGPSPILPRKA